MNEDDVLTLDLSKVSPATKVAIYRTIINVIRSANNLHAAGMTEAIEQNCMLAHATIEGWFQAGESLIQQLEGTKQVEEENQSIAEQLSKLGINF